MHWLCRRNISPPVKIEKDVGKVLNLPGMLRRRLEGHIVLLRLIMLTEHLSLSLPLGFVSERKKGGLVADRVADGEEVRR
jgi:hypothetical protein